MDKASIDPARRIIIPRTIFHSMVSHCVQSLPNEACGILAGKGNAVSEIFMMTNIKASPVSYLMDPAEQFRMMRELRDKEPFMVAIYHSHPCDPALPSVADIEQAYYEEALHIIVSLAGGEPVVKAFSIKKGIVGEVGIMIKDSM